MDTSNSQYNSASESGWTNYLDQSSSLSANHFNRRVGYEGKGGRTMEEEEEEDLSMVSDASSGPPQHYHVDQDEQPYTKESKRKVKEFGRNQQRSPLDDTATSSPVLNNYPKKKGAMENTLDFSPSFSATRIKRKPKIQKHFGGKQASEEAGGFDEEEEERK